MAFTFLTLIIFPTVFSIESNCNGGACTPFTTDEKQQILDIHNELRDRVAGGGLISAGHPAATDMNSLIWDDGLENVAQQYAETCPGLTHNTNASITYLQQRNDGNVKWGPDTELFSNFVFCANQDCIPVGENIIAGDTGTIYTISSIILNIESGWFQEYKNWTFGIHTDGCDNNAQCGHYTQMVWANTRYLGCGYSNGCSNGTIFLCNYWPAGNFNPVTPYEQATLDTTCSNCMSDRTQCKSDYVSRSNNADPSQPYNALCDGGACPTMCDGGSFNRDSCEGIGCDGNNILDCNDGTIDKDNGRDICNTNSPTSDARNPTVSPTRNPSSIPTLTPTNNTTISPSINPTRNPSSNPSFNPTSNPTLIPTAAPTVSISPTRTPTFDTSEPTKLPSINPTNTPTESPTFNTATPTTNPTTNPTTDPTIDPTNDPTIDPTIDPTTDPTTDPTIDPTVDPTNPPSMDPTYTPSLSPTDITRNPTTYPTTEPTIDPTSGPTIDPTNIPTIFPTEIRMNVAEENKDDGIILAELWWVWLLIVLIILIGIVIFVICRRSGDINNNSKIENEYILSDSDSRIDEEDEDQTSAEINKWIHDSIKNEDENKNKNKNSTVIIISDVDSDSRIDEEGEDQTLEELNKWIHDSMNNEGENKNKNKNKKNTRHFITQFSSAIIMSDVNYV